MNINILYNKQRGLWQTIISNDEGKRISVREYKEKKELFDYLKNWGMDEEQIEKHEYNNQTKDNSDKKGKEITAWIICLMIVCLEKSS